MPSFVPTLDPASVSPNLGGIEGVDFVEHIFHIAPEVSSDESQIWVLAVDTVILALTLLGAFFILGRLSWGEYTRHAATTRIRLVESLIFTDVIMGVTGLIGCGLMLNKKPLVIDTPLCDGLGVVMVATIFSQHLWTLSLAVATFMILVHPLHSLTSWIEKYWLWLWPVIWAIAFGVSVLGYILYGYGPSGGICYYQNNSGLFAELIQFLPRAIVFICIAVLYGKLYVFLRRPDKIRSGLSDHSTSSLSKLKGSWFNSRGSRARKPRTESGGGGGGGGGGWFGRGQKTIIVDDAGHRLGGSSAENPSSTESSEVKQPTSLPVTPKFERTADPELKHPKPQRLHKRNTVVSPDLPPWEHVELPVFQVDGEQFGGTGYAVHERGIWRDWSGFAGRKRFSAGPNSVCSVPTPITSPTKGLFDGLKSPDNTLYEDKVSPTNAFFDGARPLESPAVPFSHPPQLADIPRRQPARSVGSEGSLTTTAVDSSAPQSPKTPKDPSKDVQSSPPRRHGSVQLSESVVAAVVESVPAVPVPRSPRSTTAPPLPMPLPNPTNSVAALMYDGFDPSRRGSIPDGTLPFRRASGFALPAFPLPTSMTQTQTQTSISRLSTPHESMQDIPGNIDDLPRAGTPQSVQFTKDVEKGVDSTDGEDDDEEDENGMWDLFRMLKEAPPEAAKDPFAVQTNASEKVEYVQESMASYLNRKTALLMLWFPLGYVVLFSVSTIRIIWDFAGDPPIELRAISRWMMFGQGLLDAFIYGIVEWHTKRVVRRRVRKGTFSPHTSRGGKNSATGLGSAIRQFSPLGRTTNPNTRTNEGQPQTASGIRNPTSPTVSFVDPEQSILQRLKPGGEGSEESLGPVPRSTSEGR